MTSVADRMREAMALRGITQADIVSRTQIGKSSISTYLSGEYEPKQRNLHKIAGVLGVDPAWLLGLDVPMDPAQRVQEPAKQAPEQQASDQQELDDLEWAALDGMKELTDEQKRAIVQIIKAMKE